MIKKLYSKFRYQCNELRYYYKIDKLAQYIIQYVYKNVKFFDIF